jgi:hypothetical protein
MLRWIAKIIAVLTALAGVVWFLQGVNVLPGSYMTGDPQWAVNGVIAVLAGAAIFWFASRRR